MFCNKDNVNILTAYLLAAGIEDAVVCPGSRNAVIVHNLNECATGAVPYHSMRLHPVTDERSAAFVAIGLWLRTRKPIVVCVTSGSALLNLLPGVAEAYYRHIPLILISADRPAEWIGQLDGQTLPQPNALLPYAKCWDISEGDAEDVLRSKCEQALSATDDNGGSCVHINVPLREPLFSFTTPQLPTAEFCISQHPCDYYLSPDVLRAIRESRHPAIIIGQWEEGSISCLAELQGQGWTIFAENISNQGIFNDTLPAEGIDLLIHIGGVLVEKRLKLKLRELPQLTVIRIDETDEYPATFGHVDYKIKAHPGVVLKQIAEEAVHHKIGAIQTLVPLTELPVEALFVGNSTAVRWANQHLHITAPVYCNRGVNGIEGSLSVAAGYALAASKEKHPPTLPTLCLIGDLSFFYDCNALWNQHLTGNLRILLINNKKGGIFYRLPKLDESPALNDYIAASHNNNARGIAESYHCTYLSAQTSDLSKDFDKLLGRLLDTPSERPVILEVSIN